MCPTCSHLHRCALRNLPEDDDAALVIGPNLLPSLIHLDHGRLCRVRGVNRVNRRHFKLTTGRSGSPVRTFQHLHNQGQVRGQEFHPLHVGNGPDGNELITVHLRDEVQVLGQVLSAAQRSKGALTWSTAALKSVQWGALTITHCCFNTVCARVTWRSRTPAVSSGTPSDSPQTALSPLHTHTHVITTH